MGLSFASFSGTARLETMLSYLWFVHYVLHDGGIQGCKNYPPDRTTD